MPKYEMIKYKDFLWIVKRKMPDNPDIDVKAFKEACYADIALRRGGYLYLCEIVQDVEIIEEGEDEENDNQDKKEDKNENN